MAAGGALITGGSWLEDITPARAGTPYARNSWGAYRRRRRKRRGIDVRASGGDLGIMVQRLG